MIWTFLPLLFVSSTCSSPPIDTLFLRVEFRFSGAKFRWPHRRWPPVKRQVINCASVCRNRPRSTLISTCTRDRPGGSRADNDVQRQCLSLAAGPPSRGSLPLSLFLTGEIARNSGGNPVAINVRYRQGLWSSWVDETRAPATCSRARPHLRRLTPKWISPAVRWFRASSFPAKVRRITTIYITCR